MDSLTLGAAFGSLSLNAGALKQKRERVKTIENSRWGQQEGCESDINYVVLVWQLQRWQPLAPPWAKVGFSAFF